MRHMTKILLNVLGGRSFEALDGNFFPTLLYPFNLWERGFKSRGISEHPQLFAGPGRIHTGFVAINGLTPITLTGMFCRYVAGCKLKFNYNWKTACTFADYDRSVRLPPPKCQTGRRDGSRVYSYDFKPALNICFGKKNI